MKNNKKKNIFFFGVFLLFWFGNLLSFMYIDSREDSYKENSSLQLSAGEITIITPENKTYSKAMNGYYPATYGFENDIISSNPQNFTAWEGGGTVNVINYLDEHRDCVEIHDMSSSDWAGFYNIFEQGQSTGTIEVYVRFSNTNKHHELSIRDGGPFNFIYLGFIDGAIRYNDGGGWINTYICFVVDQWYHVKIEFDCAIDNKWYLWIDGNSIDGGPGFNFYGNPSEMDTLFFGTHNTDSNYYYSIDAIGYSWDQNYEINDNFYEGLLLSYENTIALDWVGYSLDSQVNKTILGNNSIPMPYNGTHTIQLFGNNTLGTMYESEKVYFTMDYGPINIVTPKNETYFDPMEGYFPATYGFENNEDGLPPDGWVNSSGGSGCSWGVIPEFEGHKKVLELNDQHPTNYLNVLNYFPTFLVIETVELWFYPSSTSDSKIVLRSGGADNANFLDIGFIGDVTTDYIYYYDGVSNNIFYTGYIEKWYHFRFEIDYENDIYDIYMDGNKVADNCGFSNPADSVRYIRFRTWQDNIGSIYIDAIGFSSDPTYRIGDNLKEGFLFSFKNDTKFEWAEYSFDGQVKLPLSGNTTLSLPDDGIHTVQVFARDSSGFIYESEVRYFNISIAPFVKWLSPSKDEVVTLPFDNSIFNFQYSYRRLVNVTLEINGTDYGRVWNMTSIDLSPYSEDIDGYVTAVLNGYEEGMGVPTVSDSRNFTFAKIVSEITELLDYGNEYIGQKIYLILHDPPGDNSFSGYSESTSLSIGINSKFSQSHAIGLEVDGSLFGVGLEASANIKATWGTETQYQFQVTDITELVSSQDSTNKDYIGPGYGDRYWGEAVTYNWQLKAFYRSYFNGTQRYEQPSIYWGLHRSSEVFLNDYNAPNNWRNLNPFHNNWSNVEWRGDLSIDGGSPFTETYITKTSTKRIDTFQINIDASVSVKIPHVKLTYSLELEWQNQEEHGTEEEFKTSFTIYDDESTDQISFEYGIDELFSTYIFRAYPDSCWTSNPLEYSTFDYVPPLILFPEIELDSSQDGHFPCVDDEPEVNVKISDEGGIQAAWINYSADEGINWDYISLSEQIANPGTWEGTLPSQEHETNIIWYIVAWDNVGSKTTRKNPHGNPYGYTIINRNPSVLVITPNGGEEFKNELTIQWLASDPDGDSLTYAIAYNDGGIGWHLINTSLTVNSYIWDISNLLYSDSILIKVIAYDDYGGISEDISDFLFTIEGRKPDGFEFPFFETMSIVSIRIAVFAAAVVLRKFRVSSK